ncbi:hypothetical protein AJ79_09442 [Helicocarpus griseus UAMH5409]|uniref:Uncharacterized protein n=1 Tax=Helicocarpus griseus UAMH5409 TaxID=1447875 RepID=A0A2B7WJQ2_9EURO|nr:hypothetical protein AJ79_09442 [Helicocarpus griseus UAMH5409]
MSSKIRRSVEVATDLPLNDEVMDQQCKAAADGRPFDLVVNNCQRYASEVLVRLRNSGAITKQQFAALPKKGFKPLV